VSTTAADSIAGIVIPDTALVREITAFIREAEDDLLVDHSRRVFLFGALHGRRRGLQPDLELLYAGWGSTISGSPSPTARRCRVLRSTVLTRRATSCWSAARNMSKGRERRRANENAPHHVSVGRCDSDRRRAECFGGTE
jgi:hypothetical protein